MPAKDNPLEFLDAAANWADYRKVDVIFQRDVVDGWFATIRIGPRSRFVDAIYRRHGKPAESPDDYEDRVADMMSKACVELHRPKC